MKTYQVRIVIVMTIFFVTAGSIGICSKDEALLAIIVQLLCEDVFDIWQIPDEKWWNERNILIEVIGNEFDNPELLK